MNEVFLLFLATSRFYPTFGLHNWTREIISCFLSNITYIKLAYFELILYKLIQNSRILKEVESEPREE